MKLHTEKMKLIAITTPTFFVEEDQIITALFEEGLDILHLRKPETAPMYSERLLTLIPAKYHKRIVVHDHFYLQEEFGLMGVHLSERNPNEPHDFSGHLTTSCTSLEELRSKKRYYDYTILYPVFDGISPSAMPAGFTPEELQAASRSHLIDSHVVALGGICEEHIRQVKKLGFGGAVLMGDLWRRFDACTNRDYTEIINQFIRLRKIID